MIRFGRLFCLVVFFLGISFSSGILKFTAAPFAKNVRSINVKDNITISCKTNEPDSKVDLYKGEKSILEHYGEEYLHLIKKIGQEFYLYDIDLFEGGSYRCNAKNSKGEEISLSLGILIISPAPCHYIPEIEPSTLTVNFDLSEDISLQCKGLGVPGALTLLTWKKDNIKVPALPEKQHRQFNRYMNSLELRIENATIQEQGRYTCIRSMCNKTTDRSINLVMNSAYKPMVSVNNHSIIHGKSKTIECRVDSSPLSTIEWITNTTVKTCKKVSTCKFDITDHQYKRTLICRAKNLVGETSKVIHIGVLVPPVIEPYDPSTEESVNVQFGCKVLKGYPLPHFDWQSEGDCNNEIICHKKWRSLTSDEIIEITPNSMTLTERSVITFKSRDGIGRVRCVARNVVGNATAYVSVNMKAVKKEGKDKPVSVVGIVCGFSLLIAIFASMLFCYNRYIRKKFAPLMQPNAKFKFDPDRSLFEQSIELPYDPSWEFPRERLDLVRVIGSGAFGQVWFAHAHGILSLNPHDKSGAAARNRTRLRLNEKVTSGLLKCVLEDDTNSDTFVAVKTLKNCPSDVEYKDLASEIKILIHLGEHANIVNLLGACTRDGQLCAIMEYCPHGNLIGFLRPRREIFSLQWAKQAFNFDEDFCWLDATNAAFQIAKGMIFLSEKKLVHRDLAARNILVGPDYVMKIADFGLARDIYSSDVYIKEGNGMLPVKWMAPESLYDQIYTVKSDVWSFGIVLWEICTMGGSPYPALPTENIFEFLNAGNRMTKPLTCPDELYEIMVQCWEERPEDRPWFNDISSQLQRIIEKYIVMTDNLATFERIQSISEETAYLVPKSPVVKKGSLDTMLRLTKCPTLKKFRKRSVDLVVNFPPIDESDIGLTNEQYDYSPRRGSGYVDLFNLPPVFDEPEVFEKTDMV